MLIGSGLIAGHLRAPAQSCGVTAKTGLGHGFTAPYEGQVTRSYLINAAHSAAPQIRNPTLLRDGTYFPELARSCIDAEDAACTAPVNIRLDRLDKPALDCRTPGLFKSALPPFVDRSVDEMIKQD